jgi:2-dehydropantoate 2-reductase
MAYVPPARSTVAVVGLGSIGGIAVGCLRDADRHDVIVCTRRPIERLVLERPEGTVDVSLHALHDPARAQRVDWVLLCTKGHQTPSATPWLRRLCDSATRVAVLQNGIGHIARISPLVGGAAVIPAIVYFNGERLGPDRVRLRHAGQHDLAVADDGDGEAFAQLFHGTPLRVLLSSDFATLAWRKLLINAVANPITALTLQRQAVFRRADVHALCIAILDEAVAVARADGARLADDESERTMATLLTYPPEAGTSMYFDRLAGRALEVEALTGAIVAAGERLGLATPLNRMLLTLLRAVSDAAG